jgi:hypothetical protein
MTIRAENDPRYSRRFLIMGIIAIGFALYCVYDGAVMYPASRARGFEEFRKENPTISTTDAVEFEATATRERRAEWQLFAEHYGFKTGPEIVTQYIMAAITGAVGLFLLSIPIRCRGRWIEIDDSGVRSSWGQSFEFDQVELINKRKWRDKGIAKVYYIDGNRRRLFVVDDFKFMRGPTDEILFVLEQRIDFERITGGPPESPPGHTEAAAEPAASVSDGSDSDDHGE